MGKLSVETEYDKAVDAVATSLADCYMRKKYGNCTDESCKGCDTYKQQVSCLNNMPDIDKIRVDNTVSRQILLRDPPEEESTSGIDAFKIKLDYDIRCFFNETLPVLLTPVAAIIIVIMIACAANCTINSLWGQSLSDYNYSRYALPGEASYAGKYRKHILDILDKTKRYTYDLNLDGEINCVDYACTFKLLWDKQYDPNDCEIVRNKSRTMNHLFIRVRQYAGTPWECIEPQAALKDINRYFMEDFWPPDIYNPVYNNYEEAEYWYGYAKQCFR